IVADARREAAAIVEGARADARRVRRSVVERAYRHGLAGWYRRYRELEEARGRAIDEARPQVIELALAVAAKVLRRRVELDPTELEDLVDAMLAALGPEPGARLVLETHPDHVDALGEAAGRLAPGLHLRVVGDAAMEPGDCKLTSEHGAIDATVDVQLRAIRSLLLSEVER
ncbi:MAG: FliH/SctL family protein, partial [Acidobacteriota bacterium]